MKKFVAALSTLILLVAEGVVWTNDIAGVRWISEEYSKCVSIVNVRLIDAAGGSHDGEVAIPRTLNDYPVRKISQGAFKGQDWIHSVLIHEGVRRIGVSAFSDCSSLTNVVMFGYPNGPGGVETIEECAFMNCRRLSRIDFPLGLVAVQSQAFSGCRSLTHIALPGRLYDLGWGAFESCAGLERVVLPPLLKLRDNPFVLCNGLRDIAVAPSSRNLKVRDGVLYNGGMRGVIAYPAKKDESSFVVPEGVEAIASFAFANADRLKSVRLPRTLRAIHPGAFCESGLLDVEIPDCVEGIGELAFASSAVTNVVVGSAVKFIGRGCFAGCKYLRTVRLRGDEPELEDDVFPHNGCEISVGNTKRLQSGVAR